MSRDCCVALPRGAMGLSAVYDCGVLLIKHTYYFCFLKIGIFISQNTHTSYMVTFALNVMAIV